MPSIKTAAPEEHWIIGTICVRFLSVGNRNTVVVVADDRIGAGGETRVIVRRKGKPFQDCIIATICTGSKVCLGAGGESLHKEKGHKQFESYPIHESNCIGPFKSFIIQRYTKWLKNVLVIYSRAS